jgi:hypothetical protein
MQRDILSELEIMCAAMSAIASLVLSFVIIMTVNAGGTPCQNTGSLSASCNGAAYSIDDLYPNQKTYELSACVFNNTQT